MNKEIATQNQNINSLVNSPAIKDKFREILGKKSAGFVASILQVVNQSEMLKHADPMSILSAASIAATLDLPINPNLGFAYIIPYNDRKSGKQVAQFQMGYKGFIQLAQRSGLYKTISATPVYDGQIISADPLKGYKFDFTKKVKDAKVAGYAGFFELLNGFEKTMYMTVAELEAHGVKYSQSMRKGYGLWKDNFDAMATKTVIKLLLSKFAPLSIDMQTATITDQAIIKDPNTLDVEYIDHNAEPVMNLKSANLTTGLKIKGEKKVEEAETTEKEPEVENADQESAPSEAIADEADTEYEPIEGEFICTKCKDVSILKLDGPQDCQVCGAHAWKPATAANKAMAKGMAKSRK